MTLEFIHEDTLVNEENSKKKKKKKKTDSYGVGSDFLLLQISEFLIHLQCTISDFPTVNFDLSHYRVSSSTGIKPQAKKTVGCIELTARKIKQSGSEVLLSEAETISTSINSQTISTSPLFNGP